MSSVTINGLVKLSPGNQNLSNVKVEIWDQSGDYGWLASGQTDKKGKFSIVITDPHASLITATTITVGYRVFRNEEKLTISSVTNISGVETIVIKESAYDDKVTDNANELVNPYLLINGKITNSAGVAATDIKVNIYEGGFRDKTLLGTTDVDVNGSYKIKISAKNISNYGQINEKCVYVEVVDESDVLLVRSKDFFDLKDRLIVDLSISDEDYDPTSEYEVILDAITTVIGDESITSITRNEETNIDEFSFIARSIGKEIRDVENVVRAHNYSFDVARNYDYADFFYALNKLSSDSINPSKLYNGERIKLAVSSAMEDVIIPEHTVTEVDDFIKIAKEYHVAEMGGEIIEGESYTFRDVLMSIFGDAGDVKDMMMLYHAKQYTEIADFWDDYKTTYGTPKYTLAQKGLKLIPLTGVQPQMIEFLLDETSASDNLSALAEWDSDDWYDAIDDLCTATSTLCVPKSIRRAETDPANARVKREYADFLKAHLQEYYPLTTIKTVLGGAVGDGLISDADIRGKVVSFIADNPEFDLRVSSVYDINEEDYIIREEDVDIVKGGLEPFQRLLRVTQGKPDAVVQMIVDGVDSATAIMDINEEDFDTTYSAKLGGSAFAKAAYANATTIYSAAQNVITGLQTNVSAGSSGGAGTSGPGGSGGPNGPYGFGSSVPFGPITTPSGPVVIGAPSGTSSYNPSWPTYTPVVDPSVDPTWQKMFGSLDYCCCDHCMSLYSPSAYFTDILNFLRNNNVASPAYVELLRRRRDLVHIDLTCKNTNTPVPYVDLVNELLERIIVGPSNSPESYQTNGTAKELAAHPEHFYKDGSGNYIDIANNVTYYPAYQTLYNTTLAGATYPTFNFNYALEETRTYLRHLGITRYEAMKAFKFLNPTGIVNNTTVPGIEVSDYWIGMEFLNLTPTDAKVICGTHADTSAANRHRLYGFPFALMSVGSNVLDPADSSATLLGWYYNILQSRIDILLHFSKISYTELLKFLSTDFINPLNLSNQHLFAIEAWTGVSPDTCDLHKLKLTMTDPSLMYLWFADRLHKFLRLYRRNTLTIYEWDTLFRKLSIGMDQTTPSNNLNNTTVSLLAEVLQLSKTLDIDPLVLVGWTSQIDTKHYIAHDCAGITEHPSVYDKIFRNKAIQNPPSSLFGENATFSSGAYFIDNAATIASVCGVSEEEMLLLLDFVRNGSNNPLSTASLQIQLTGLSRLYVLCQISKALKISVKEMLTVFKFISISYIQTPTWSDLRKFLTTVELLRKSPFTINEIDYLVCNVDERDITAPDALTIQLFFQGLRSELKKFAPYTNPGTTLSGQLLDNAQALVNIILQHFSKQFGILSVWAERIFGSEIQLPTPPTGIAGALMESSFVLLADDTNPIDLINYPLLHERYRLFFKMAMVANRLKLKHEEFMLLNDLPGIIDFDFAALPIGIPNVSTPPNEFEGFTRLLKWIEVRDRLGLVDTEFIALLTHGQTGTSQFKKDTWRGVLEANTTWGSWLDDLVDIPVGQGGLLDTIFPNDFSSSSINGPSLVLGIADIVSICDRVGLNPITLQKVLLDNLNISDSNKVRFAAKSKHDENAWLKIAKPLQDTIRERQRCALVNYVLRYCQDPVNYRIWQTESELYAYLLIDVEMSPCMMTSRIKQAISSVQLYVDRILLSQEYTATVSPANIALQASQMKQWSEWRKWYRIWEANRKVFLYPENWIEPELRDDKTIFFEELETKLAQGDITDSLVEDAVNEYLHKLSDVAKLEPVGFVESYNAHTQKNIIHAFARTYEQPNQYYYRRLIDDEWTGWERVSIDINSRHVVPVVRNNRLFLFWVTFAERKQPVPEGQNGPINWSNTGNEIFYNDLNGYSDGNVGSNGKPISDAVQQSCLDVTLNWSEYKDGEFNKQKTSHSKFTVKLHPLYEKYFKSKLNTPGAVGDFYASITNQRNVSPADIIKSRLGLYAYTYEDLRFFLMFPLPQTEITVSGVNERAYYVGGFIFKDINGQPEIYEGHETWNFPTLEYTYFNDMKFVEYGGTDRQLKFPNITFGFPGYTSINHYWYRYNGVYNTNNAISPHVGQQTILQSTGPNGRFKITPVSSHWYSVIDNYFFFQDDKHVFFARKVKNSKKFGSSLTPAAYNLNLNNPLPNVMYPQPWPSPIDGYFFQTFYHPRIEEFLWKFGNEGIKGLLNIDMQAFTDSMDFVGKYQPTSLVHNNTYPTDKVELDFWGSYSVYNWELFFHIPILVAQRLMDNQRFDEAQNWFHFVFDPTSNTGLGGAPNNSKQRFWKFKIFYDQAGMNVQTLNDLLILIAWNDANTVAQVEQWKNNPFKPHLIARTRILAYMKNVVMKYLDNLIAWADQLFARDTIESINEATNLYIMAANILGAKPVEVPKRAYTSPKSFSEIESSLDAFSNATVAIEGYISPNVGPLYVPGPVGPKKPPRIKTFYFCLSPNDKLLKYWDTIADRLYKIRNCRNISGQIRQLPLFDPPIDPAMLVRAAAAGIDINSILDDVSNASLSNYRFTYMLQKANEICSDLKGLSSSLLSALEKKDAEELALIRSTQELTVLEGIKLMKITQLSEAKANLIALNKTREVTQVRFDYYSSRQMYNNYELQYFSSLKKAMSLQRTQANLQALASAVSIIPQFHLQVIAAVGAQFGGQQLSAILNGVAQKLGANIAKANFEATVANTKGSYIRRWEDWDFQKRSASKELEQIDKQIAAAEIRVSIAEKDIENQELEIENNRETDAYMRSKYTNVQLYNWMITQISTTYFQAYRLAYEVARKAGNCYDFELPLAEIKAPKIIQFGYWDSLRKGLLVGEKLQNDLRKLEQAYVSENKRTFELTKHVSLASLNAEQLQALKVTGTCSIDIPEELYDLDYPGHFNRRIKSVSISIPCVAGPYTTVPCTLSLNGNSIVRIEPDNTPFDITSVPPNWQVVPNVVTSSIATSGGQNDSGMFEFNFRDERYLPFEGAGAISKWNLALGGVSSQSGVNPALRPFDFNTISDVILHVKYTAQDGGSVFAQERGDDLYNEMLTNGKLGEVLEDVTLPLLISLKHQFSTEWYAGFKELVATIFTTTPPNIARKFTVPISIDLFPHFCKETGVEVTNIHIYAIPKDTSADYIAEMSGMLSNAAMTLDAAGTPVPFYNTNGFVSGASVQVSDGDNMDLVLQLYKHNGSPVPVNEEDIDDFYVVLEYKLQ